ncbi:hypothetical protein VIGAN_07208800 [Vigna angularis var. angularis]|uniref:Uncharacterized protein n=1 Tax=Vigna angularis var. angularis TaxID=157739 RepID=A0A0S3SK36_PHAAN|nr:hypothetical protein VIGAN_07208800 [Vigna angularis var. angularis]
MGKIGGELGGDRWRPDSWSRLATAGLAQKAMEEQKNFSLASSLHLHFNSSFPLRLFIFVGHHLLHAVIHCATFIRSPSSSPSSHHLAPVSITKPAAKNGSITASAKKGKPAAAASSSDLSEASSDEDDVPKTKAVPAATKNITSSNKKTQPSGSSDSDSDSSSDEDDKKKISATTKLPASSDDDSSEDSDEDDDVKPSATTVSKPAVSKKKVDSFDSDDSSFDEDNKKAAKKVSNAKSMPVSKQPVKTSSTSDSDEENRRYLLGDGRFPTGFSNREKYDLQGLKPPCYVMGEMKDTLT